MYVVIIAMAPCAKLTMFVARKMSTRPRATAATIMPVAIPPRVMFKKNCMIVGGS
jgi:hypothetical protein